MLLYLCRLLTLIKADPEQLVCIRVLLILIRITEERAYSIAQLILLIAAKERHTSIGIRRVIVAKEAVTRWLVLAPAERPTSVRVLPNTNEQI